MRTFSTTLTLFLSLSCLHGGDILRLTNKSGKALNAEVVSLEDDKATLRRSDGKEFITSLKTFSEASRALITETWAKQASSVSDQISSLNKALGAELFAGYGNLWGEEVSEVASRLKWPMDSKTPFTSSYRLYTRPDYLFAGAHPYTVVAYGNEGAKTESFSLIYSNKGDSLSTVGSGEDHFNEDGKKIDRSTLEGAMDYDTITISKALTEVLGKGVFQRFAGQGSKTVKAERWDWNGHSFLLTNAKEEYVGLRIVKTSFADEKGKTDRISDGDMRIRLKANVKQEDNGDVYIDNIPMVDQGPKGYCAPATFERAMRHAGAEADMYLLATLATSAGGGTYTGKLYDEVAFTTRSKGGRTAREIDLKSLQPKKLKKYIDKGVPILWQMCSLPHYNNVANTRTEERKDVSDWADYTEQLEAEAAVNVPKLGAKGNHHICMIIGYNETTNEVAVSDSWGSRYTIRWVHVDEAEAVSNESGFVIDL